MTSSSLYPAVEPYAIEMLPVDELHTLYVEQSGRQDGVPVVYLHGGPGSPTSERYRRFFDPRHYRIVLYEQRGVGRSTPHAELRENTTWHLVEDLERLRRHLGVERWHLSGGSWGSTLALAYAESHPERCLSLALRGIFLASAGEIDWFLHGMGRFFPEAERDFLAPIPEAERSDLLAAFDRRLSDPDPAVHGPAAVAWSSYEGACVSLLPQPATVADFASASKALSLARLECRYFRNLAWLEPDQLLRDAGRLRGIPAAIVQGRYDVICPLATADALVRAWPTADYVVVPDAGHAVTEPGIAAALVAAADRFRAIAA